jgi:uracil-DNA glycosylase
MIGPVITGVPVVSPVMLIGQAPGGREGTLGKPFAWTAGKTLFGWFGSLGLAEEDVRTRIYIAAVCRCFPGKTRAGGDRVPDADEIERCSKHLHAELRILRPRLVIPVGKLAIARLFPEVDKLAEIIGTQRRATLASHTFDAIALPHPSGASTWHRTQPGVSLLAAALAKLGAHEAWRSLATVGHRETARDEIAAAIARTLGAAGQATERQPRGGRLRP